MQLYLLLIILKLGIQGGAFANTNPPISPEFSFAAPCDKSESPITLAFVGDILIHKALYQAVVTGTQHFSQLWQRTDSLIQKADFAAGNLEGLAAMGLTERGQDLGDIGFVYDGEVYSGTNFLFNYHPRILFDLKKSGFDLLTMANNHVFDRGAWGIDKTIKAAQDARILTVGTRPTQERNQPFYQTVKIKSIQVAFLGCTEMINLRPTYPDQILYCYTQETLRLIKEISSRPDIDALIVMPHWGNEYSPLPEEYQILYAKRFLEAGATAIIGSHPHVLQPWQKHITRDLRETLVVYSLGNFIAGQAGIERKTSAVVYLGLSKQGAEKAKIVGAGFTPTQRTDFELHPISKTKNREAFLHTKKFLGEKNYIEPQDPLLPALCKK